MEHLTEMEFSKAMQQKRFRVKKIIVSKDMAQKLFYSRYLETKEIGLPLYKDYEGQLKEELHIPL